MNSQRRLLLIALMAMPLFWVGYSFRRNLLHRVWLSDVGGFPPSLFSRYYPGNETFKSDLNKLRRTGKLLPENEILIQRTLTQTSELAEIPIGLLWCLLFQESKFDHLSGKEGDRAAFGLGQFSYFSFFEINNHLTRYEPKNLNLMQTILGQDVRPIGALPNKLMDPSSYYFIPTAVVSSAVYLKNRYFLLKRALNKKGLSYNPDLLWLYSAMAYNKGTRSVYTFWNQTQEKRGSSRMDQILLEHTSFQRLVRDEFFLNHSLKRIWLPHEARHYTRELMTHMRNIAECALHMEKTSQSIPLPKEVRK